MECDEDLLETAVRRKSALAALAEEPRHRRELQAELDLSKTTCHRIVRTFDEKNLVRRTESGYDLSLLGRIVAEAVTRFEGNVETACRLNPLLELFESSSERIDDSVFTDADVTWAVERDRSLTLDKGVELVKDSAVIRVLDWTPVPELYLEEIFGIIAEGGMKAESIYPKAEVETRLERLPELHEELADSDARARYWVDDDVPPWGMTIYGDSLVQLRAYEPDSGAYVLDATADDPEAVEWAMDVFTTYRDRAEPLTAIDDLPDWGDYSWGTTRQGE
ncbi:MAG: putative transcriptional regulator [Halobacteriales archaeon]|jgi:predicted transcriptional regulator